MAFAISSSAARHGRRNGHALLCLFARLVALVAAPVARAHPFHHPSLGVFEKDDDLPKDPADASLWAYLGTAVALVLLGGAFAGLTIALMGQDEIYLQVIATSGEGSERKNARKVLKLLKKGKHWVLVTLLLSNVITNETLPIVLDRSLGGGWPAVLSSTVLIVIFGEIVPQSICVRYGLPIGAWMSTPVLGLMYIMAPVAWPTAKLLDKLLGEDHGQTYKKAGLKTLVRLHKTLGPSADEMLNEDEVTIITAVLDLKAKAVGTIMTPMKDVFTMSADTVLDEQMMEKILSAGYSRIPIYAPDNENNFVGMLLVKMLITYDPEDALRVRDFALATLPETRPETSCLDIVNFFQEGKSHMVLVSDYPGESRGALGVVTLEDVIEELIGEEIIDESDVFVDVHKAIRRMAPAPRTKVPKGEIVTDHRLSEDNIDPGAAADLVVTDSLQQPRRASTELAASPRLATTFLMRRRSSGNGSVHKGDDRLTIRSDNPEVIQHLKHLGPSNAATRPKSTRINTVKIKPGIPKTIPENKSPENRTAIPAGAPQGGIGEGILESAGREASDGVHSLAVGYGTMSTSANQNLDQGKDYPHLSPKSKASDDLVVVDHRSSPRKRSKSQSTIGSLHSIRSTSPSPGKTVRRHTARSGSISENIVDLNGVKKIVLETTSSSDSEDKNHVHNNTDEHQDRKDSVETDTSRSESAKKKKRKKRSGKNKKKGGGSGETAPLLGGGEGR